MKHSETLGKIATALVAAQGEIKAVAKDSINPHFKNRYASLDALTDYARPVLAKHGLALVQGAAVPETHEGHLVGMVIETTLIHSSGEWISTAIPIPVDKPSAQGAGSGVSYGRRYGLAALLALTTDEDDDGETASNYAPAKASAPAPAPARTAPASAPRQAAAAAIGALAEVPSCKKCGGAMWDNRLDKRNPKAPDFKCKDKNCDGAIWVQAKAAPAPAPVAAGSFEDEYNPDDDRLPF